MHTIPTWVDKNKSRGRDKASARLDYLVGLLAALHTERKSIRGLAEKIGMDHSTISLYIRKGAFTMPAATRIVETLKDPKLAVTMLTEPLTIARSPG